jgi:hypothetical protein
MINTNRMSHDPFVLRNYEPLATCHMPTSNRQQKSETVGESKKTKQLTPFGFSQIPSHAVSSD